MMTPTTRIEEIDLALHANLSALKDAFLDLLAAVVLCIIAVCSLLHAVLRIAFAVLGLLLWALALWITFLYWLRSWAVSRSASTLHGR